MSDNSFTDGYLMTIKDLFTDEQLSIIKDTLDIYTIGFNITPVTSDLIVTDYHLPKAYFVYMASKIQDGRMSESSSKQYSMCLEDMLYTLSMPLEYITINHLRAYIHKISTNRSTGKRLSSNTLNQRKSIIRSFFKWLYEEDYITKDPSLRIKQERPNSKPRTAYKDTEIEALRDSCTSSRERAIIDLLSSSGIRVSECVGLNISDIDFVNRELTVYGKGGKWRTTYINGRAVVSLQRYLSERTDDNVALFVSSKSPYERLSTSAIRKCLHKLQDSSGVDDVIPHKFRHTMATNAINNGMPLASIQALLGHSETETTLRYAHVSTEKIRRDHRTYMG